VALPLLDVNERTDSMVELRVVRAGLRGLDPLLAILQVVGVGQNSSQKKSSRVMRISMPFCSAQL
jgi:hypothetical protein